MPRVDAVRIQNEVTAVSNSDNQRARRGAQMTFQATGLTSAGAGAATILIQVSNEDTPTQWVTAATITLTLSTTRSTDGAAIDAAWKHVRSRVSAISGTDAAVSVWMGG
jgi:hypothetical protein